MTVRHTAQLNVEAAKPPPRADAAPALVVPLFAATIMLSAGLVFVVQPMFARLVLPLLGGVPAVWTGSMLFFTTALLVGYVYAHATARRLGVRRQAVLHLVLVAAAAATLPIGLPDWTPPTGGAPALWLVGLLTVAVGLPFALASATSPLLQRWLAGIDHPDAADPYFLYRASNIGSAAGLLAYPLLLEPALDLGVQTRLWSAGYLLLGLLLAACAVTIRRARPKPAAAAVPAPGGPAAGAPPVEVGEPAPTWGRRARWVALAFVPTSVSLGVTGFLTVDVAPMPLLWVLPLGLYLFSFVVVFSRGTRAAGIAARLTTLLPTVATAGVVMVAVEFNRPLWIAILSHLACLFVVAVACHWRLAGDRPHPSALTAYYGWIALGGALGAAFNGLVAPAIFDSLAEYPVGLALACLLVAWTPARRRAGDGDPAGEEREDHVDEAGDGDDRAGEAGDGEPRDGAAPGEAGRKRGRRWPGVAATVLPASLLLAGLVAADRASDFGAGERQARAALFAIAAFLCLFSRSRPRRHAVALTTIVAILLVPLAIGSDLRYRERNFFGVKQVERSDRSAVHLLMHGTTLHGLQSLDPSLARQPISYYDRTGPLGQLLDALPDRSLTRRTAVIGLGTGTAGCLSRPGEAWTFYEIDPGMEVVARDPRLFTYLRDCGRFEVVIGDARRSLDAEPSGEFGLILLDAFSSDSIPIHLLTREAIELYRDRSMPGGVLAIHVSNRYLSLEPVLGDLAVSVGESCYAQVDRSRGGLPHKLTSHWVVLAAAPEHLGGVPRDPRWHPCARAGGTGWTDGRADIFRALELGW